ncbi:MAG TPA: hypothetical protein VK464_21305 [Symbiobacteriaceae bacterium]|nr:hypothetical protein [Symbiobacteriaceae bacterium]
MLARFRTEGSFSADALANDVAGRIAHREKLLALVLKATLERLTPPARTALDFAALLPPDSVPWPWLQDLVAQADPEALRARGPGHPDPWREVRGQLEGMRLLTPTEHPEVARLHRLVSTYLRNLVSEQEGARKTALVREQLREVAGAVHEEWGQSRERPWQWAPLEAAVLHVRWGEVDYDYSATARVVGHLELKLGRMDLAEPLLRKALEAAEAFHKTDSSTVKARRGGGKAPLGPQQIARELRTFGRSGPRSGGRVRRRRWRERFRCGVPARLPCRAGADDRRRLRAGSDAT